jgi:acetate kinase
MRILAVNAGSSSLKLSVVDDDDSVAVAEEVDGAADRTHALRTFVGKIGEVDAVAHRIVHGGPHIRQATVVDDAVRRQLDIAASYAPLHVPPALALLDAARALVEAPQVVCVDTAFHADLAEYATTYAIPKEWRELGVRRFGFHGLSYAWASRRSAELLKRPHDDLQLVLAHIGSGVSVCAARGGRSVDTSMGFSPLEGAVMAKRSGSVDPGALLWLQEFHGLSAHQMGYSLEHESGLLALCGAADLRDVERGAALGDAGAVAALEVYIHVLCRNIGAVTVSLDGVDALVFTGGVGENSVLVRSRVCARLRLLAVPEATATVVGDTVIATPPTGPAVVVVAAREDAQMARETRHLLSGESAMASAG